MISTSYFTSAGETSLLEAANLAAVAMFRERILRIYRRKRMNRSSTLGECQLARFKKPCSA